MGLFRKKKWEDNDALGLIARVSGSLSGVVQRLADYLNRKTAQYSSGRWLLLLICFCLVTGSYLLSLIIELFIINQ